MEYAISELSQIVLIFGSAIVCILLCMWVIK